MCVCVGGVLAGVVFVGVWLLQRLLVLVVNDVKHDSVVVETYFQQHLCIFFRRYPDCLDHETTTASLEASVLFQHWRTNVWWFLI